MSVEFTITEADYLRSMKLAATATRRQLVIAGACGAGLLLLGLLGPESTRTVAYAGLICGIIGYLVVLYLFTPLQARRHYRSYRSVHLPLRLSLTEEGFTLATEHGENRVAWERLKHWREDRQTILVYFAPGKFYPLPTRIADAGFDLEEFRTLLRRHLGEPV
jgi:preprotein translocase subunit Sss1